MPGKKAAVVKKNGKRRDRHEYEVLVAQGNDVVSYATSLFFDIQQQHDNDDDACIGTHRGKTYNEIV